MSSLIVLDVRTLVVAAGFTCVMLSLTMLASVVGAVAQLQPGDEGVEALLRCADDALYQAKREGRNRVVLARNVAG